METAIDRQPSLSTNITFCFSKLEREDKVIDANLSICTGDCFPIGFEVDGQLPCAKLRCTICVGDARMLSLKSVVIPKLSTVVDTKRMGIVWQTLPFHLSLNENKTRQLLITNNRETSQGESCSIKTSPVNPEGCLAKLGKWTMFSTLLRWDYLNSIRFKVSDETCNSSWILNLISNGDAKCVSIIWNCLLNYTYGFKFGLHQSMGFGLLTYHQRFIDTCLEAIWKKKCHRHWVGQTQLSHFVNAARYEVTGLDYNLCLLIGSFPLSCTVPHSEIVKKIPSFLEEEANCLFYHSVKISWLCNLSLLLARNGLKRYVTMGTTQCPQYLIPQLSLHTIYNFHPSTFQGNENYQDLTAPLLPEEAITLSSATCMGRWQRTKELEKAYACICSYYQW